MAGCSLLDASEEEHATVGEDGRHLVRGLRDGEAAPVDAHVAEGRREGARELAQHLGLDPLARGDELGLALPRPREALHQVVARAGADAEGEDAGVAGVLAAEGDHVVGVADLAVGQDEDLARQARATLGFQHALERGQDLGAAEVGLEPLHVLRGLGQARVVVGAALREERLEPRLPKPTMLKRQPGRRLRSASWRAFLASAIEAPCIEPERSTTKMTSAGARRGLEPRAERDERVGAGRRGRAPRAPGARASRRG